MKLDDDSYLPEIDVNQLVVWNQKRRKCCGFLNKKGGSSGAGGIFGNRRNWQKRFFVLEHRISSDDNYLLRVSFIPVSARLVTEKYQTPCEITIHGYTSTTELTHSTIFARSLLSTFVKNAYNLASLGAVLQESR